MIHILAMMSVASAMLLPIHAQAACSRSRSVTVHVKAETADLAVRSDYRLADIARLAGSVSQQPRHPALGFYASSVGYRLHIGGAGTCGDVALEVQIVTKQRVIEVASDLDRCLADAALRHYRHHAELEAEVMKDSEQALQSSLQRFMADALLSDNNLKLGPGTPLENRLSALIQRWLDSWQAAAPSLQAASDSPDELQALDQACHI